MTTQERLLEEGRVIQDKWEILSFLAQGGKGEVYLAKQMNLNRQVALKVMSKDFLQSLEGREEEYESELQRFRREVQVMARIRHQNVLQVYDVGQVEVEGTSLDYIVMEYVPGPTLRQTMLDDGLGHDERAIIIWINKYFFPVLQGMQAVHAQGVVHRDMKPENVLIDDEVPKIADFGLAGGHYLDNITRSMHIIGTPPYMPEEQFMDLASTDARTDVYSLGKILYEAIESKMSQKRNKPFEKVHLSSPGTKFMRRLDKLIRNSTAKDRQFRTASVKALYDELADIVHESDYAGKLYASKKHKKQLMIIGGLAGIIIFALAIVFGFHLISMDTQLLKKEQQTSNGLVPAKTFNFDFKSNNFANLPEDLDKKPFKKKIMGTDGMTLRLVPGGEAQLAIDQPKSENQLGGNISVPNFYMDESKITNHLYVEFLRRVEGLQVKDNAVWRNGQIWLLLGEVLESYEPITFSNEEFRIKPGMESNPVVRVTPLGAVAYAKFYGRTLPSMAQWWRAVQAGNSQANSVEISSDEDQDGGMMMHNTQTNENEQIVGAKTDGIRSVTAFSPNKLDIRGLAQNVNEWTIARPKDQQIAFHIHGNLGGFGRQESYLQRQPWEAFARVGFRTVINIP